MKSWRTSSLSSSSYSLLCLPTTASSLLLSNACCARFSTLPLTYAVFLSPISSTYQPLDEHPSFFGGGRRPRKMDSPLPSVVGEERAWGNPTRWPQRAPRVPLVGCQEMGCKNRRKMHPQIRKAQEGRQEGKQGFCHCFLHHVSSVRLIWWINFDFIAMWCPLWRAFCEWWASSAVELVIFPTRSLRPSSLIFACGMYLLNYGEALLILC